MTTPGARPGGQAGRPGGGWLRVIMALGGVVLIAAGAFAVTRAFPGGGPGGSATQERATSIPAGVGTLVPTPAGEPAVAPMSPATPVRIEIPAIGVSAPVMKLGLARDGTIQVPPMGDHNLAGWYAGGPAPGQDGSSVILGHVDSYSGTSVFYDLKTLHPGNQVKVVRADGSTAVFSVDGLQRAAKATFPAASVYGGLSYPALRLVTCGGPFDSATGHYLDNIIVYAHLVTAIRS
jgi:sortase (surface protein transpeptidase)